MEIVVTEQAPILVPNAEHKNFTANKEVIPIGTILKGDYFVINGNRRGQNFQYRLFKIENSNKYIYTNKTIPKTMEKTEVTLGADASVSPTLVKVPSNTGVTKTHIISAIVGVLAGFGLAKYRKVEGNTKYIYMAVGGVAGYFAGQMIVKRKDVTIKKSK